MVSFFFFWNSGFPPRTCCHIFRTIYFGRSYFFTLFQSIYFDVTITFLGQLFLQNGCLFFSFSEQSLSRRSYFLQNSFFFRSVTSTEQALFQNRKFFTEITFHNSYFIGRSCLGQRCLKKSYFFKAGTSVQYRLFRKDRFWEKLIFQKSNIPQYVPPFSGGLPF